MLILIIVVAAGAGLMGWLMLRTTPLEAATDALEQRDYFFKADPEADPGLSATRAASSHRPSLGPMAGFMTHDGLGRGSDLDDQPVYLFVVDKFRDTGPVLPGDRPGPEPHVVFVYAEAGVESLTAIPIDD